MSRLLLLVVLLFAAVQFAPAQSFPKFPQQAHVTTAEHVKNFWTRTLRWQARSTRNRSASADKKNLIK
jgi:hypothetical protein